jgi:Biotin-lipoyl like
VSGSASAAAVLPVPGSAVQPPPSPQGSPPPTSTPPPNRLRRVIVRALIVGLAVLAGGLFMVDWDDLLLLSPVQRTDDAYLRGDPTTLSARVSGYLHRVAVADMETVKESQVLYEIDDAEYRAQVELARAWVAEAGAQVAIAAAQISLQERQIDVTQGPAGPAARHARFSAAHVGAGDPERPRAAGHGRGQHRHHRVADGAAQGLARDVPTDGREPAC